MRELNQHIDQIKKLCDSNRVKSPFAFGSVTSDKFQSDLLPLESAKQDERVDLKNKKMAQVRLSIEVISSATGQTIWKWPADIQYFRVQVLT